MTNDEIIELANDWFDSIEKISTREDISNEDKLLRIEATCQRCKNFLNKRPDRHQSEETAPSLNNPTCFSSERMANVDKEIGEIDEYTVMYTEDCRTICDKCCLADTCQQEGFCKCDAYRVEHGLDFEGDIYFIKKNSIIG